MQGTIYTVDGSGLRRLEPSAPESEARMQELVARYPEIISDGAESGASDLLLIRREQPVGDGEAEGRWSLDHLFVTRAGVPVLVELKRASDTRLRREVVGQMLDYAANATAYWEVGTIAASFARTVGEGADAKLAAFLGGRDPEEFWQAVDSNLKAGRIRLVFVADVIPRELAIIVEFLNAQMRADVRAVELRWFADTAGSTTLVPRMIGETEGASAAKARATGPRMAVGDWVAERIAPHGADTVAGVERFLSLAAEARCEAFVPLTAGSIMLSVTGEDGRNAHPFGVTPAGRVKLCLGYLKSRPAYRDEPARAALYDELAGLVGGLHTRSLEGEPGFPARVLLDPAAANQFSALLTRVAEAARRG